MPIIPIGADVRPRHAPIANYLLIAANVAVYLFTDVFGGGLQDGLGEQIKAYFSLDAARPSVYQYLTYQFMHGDVLHLAGNMLFLWIFGNAVCDRMGTVAYLLFYLAGGVFAGVAFTSVADNPMVGASGAIAAVTTAFLALYPRVQITILVWLVVIFTFQVPATVLIVAKMVLWDNVLAPNFDHAATSNVAYSAHLGGYAFGFVLSLTLLYIRALPRNQFDIVALYDRAVRRRGWTVVSAGGPPGARRVRVQELESRPLDEIELSESDALREEIALRLEDRDPPGALRAYERLKEIDRGVVLPARQLLAMANVLAHERRYAESAEAYESYLSAYPAAPDRAEIHLYLGMIFNRYLADPARAAEHLRTARPGLRLAAQTSLADEELAAAEARLPR